MNTRRAIALAAIGMLALIVAIDIAVSDTPNPYLQPPVFSLGSGQAASGAMCTTVLGPVGQ